ncbi:alpha-E domain-containing protein, partial [Rhodopseudomonas palustris]|nr:alpha-E domain-containing protein [Rhodopseudomonas palustris]
LGRLKADLEYTDIDEVIDSGLHEFLDNLQRRLNTMGGTIGTTFFNITPQAIATSDEQSQTNLQS